LEVLKLGVLVHLFLWPEIFKLL